jgi:protein-S-isoprenylcysteine O-methyltransferase Ste14
MMIYETIILLCWAAFILFWLISAFNVKKDIRGGFSSVWRQYWLLRLVGLIVVVFVAARIAAGTAPYANLDRIFSNSILNPLFPSLLLGWISAALTVIGVGFAIWARVNLGRNWSPRPAVKESHELVTTGAYKYVRHPIYTGLILMAFAMALTGSISGICVFIFAGVVFILRINKEEKLMLELFPNEYPSYQKRTKKLVPYIW